MIARGQIRPYRGNFETRQFSRRALVTGEGHRDVVNPYIRVESDGLSISILTPL
jgi:hypothetical protein